MLAAACVQDRRAQDCRRTAVTGCAPQERHRSSSVHQVDVCGRSGVAGRSLACLLHHDAPLRVSARSSEHLAATAAGDIAACSKACQEIGLLCSSHTSAQVAAAVLARRNCSSAATAAKCRSPAGSASELKGATAIPAHTSAWRCCWVASGGSARASIASWPASAASMMSRRLSQQNGRRPGLLP